MKPQFYLVCGRSAVGKTEFASEFAKVVDACHIDVDEIYERTSRYYDTEEKFWVWLEVYKQIHLYMEAGMSCILDSNCLTSIDRDQFLGWFPKFEHHLIYMDASDELVWENNLNRARKVPNEKLVRQKSVAKTPDYLCLDERWVSYIRIFKRDKKDYAIYIKGKAAITDEVVEKILNK